MKKITPRSVSFLSSLSALGLALVSSTAHAADLYWNQSTYRTDSEGQPTSTYINQFNTAGNWSTDAAGTTASGAVPTISDNLFFNSTPNNGLGGGIAIETGNAAAHSMTFNATGNTNFSPNNNRVLTLGSGGITLNSTSGAVTFGSSSRSFQIETNAAQTWTNHSTNQLAARVVRVSDTAAGPVVLTLNAASTGNIFLSTHNQGITDSLDGLKSLALVIDSTGTGEVVFGGSATYTGGTTIKQGILRTNSTASGTAAVNLGHTSGNANATFRINTTSAFTTGLISVAGNTGVNLLEFINTSGTYDGAITLNNALNIGVRSSGATGVTINGVISGDGDLIKGQYQDGDSGVLILAGANTYTGDTLINNGAFTLAATTGSLTFVIGADGVNNQVTASATHSGAVTFNGTFNFDLGGAVLEDGNSWLIVDKAKLTNTSFTSTFAVNGFSESGNIWTNGSGFSFSEASGILSYTAVPEPSTYATLIGVGALGLCLVRRRQTA